MTRIRSAFLVAALLSAPLHGLAATPGLAAPQEPHAAGARPRIGLVLGGGGAMGAAHIGVIKVLEEMHVPVDCVAGTSMGALVGGAYSSGMSAAELDRFVTSIDWQGVFSTQQVRRYQPVSVKRENETVSNKLEFGPIGGIPRLLDIGQCNDPYSAIQIAVALANAFGCRSLRGVAPSP